MGYEGTGILFIFLGLAAFASILGFVLSIPQSFKKSEEKLGKRIEAVAAESRKLHEAVAKSTASSVPRDLGDRIDKLTSEFQGLRHDVLRIQGAIEQIRR